MIRAGGIAGAPSHTGRIAPSQAFGAARSRSSCPTRSPARSTVVADPFELDRRRTLPVGLTVSTGWDRDEAYTFVEELFAKHQNEIYAYLLRMLRDPDLAADLAQDAFVKAYRALRLAPEARERPGVAVPDRPPRRARPPAPRPHRPVHPARRRERATPRRRRSTS